MHLHHYQPMQLLEFNAEVLQGRGGGAEREGDEEGGKREGLRVD